jgi:hypothetical protein
VAHSPSRPPKLFVSFLLSASLLSIFGRSAAKNGLDVGVNPAVEHLKALAVQDYDLRTRGPERP